MGDEIQTSEFTRTQFREFERRLKAETRLFAEQLHSGVFEEQQIACGFEAEAWLVDAQFRAAPLNKRLLNLAKHPLLFPELARFNFEINNTPRKLAGSCLSQTQRELHSILEYCREIADNLDAEPVLFGILPTLSIHDLTLEHISEYNRYRALNEQVLSQRGRPLKIEISGREHLRVEHRDVMLEAATTSFQVHMQVPATQAAHYYNASLQASAATVAAAANSPFLFGKHLFSETRIPLFEQAVEVGGYAAAAQGPLRRVSFGSSYVKHSIAEILEENLEHFPPLLPTLFDDPPEQFKHLQLHNGTIWRWNRPLIGVNSKHPPHVRIEHRVIPAGPTLPDMFANAAFYYGLTYALAHQQADIVPRLSFATAKDNFYKAAQHGLDARISWLDKRTVWVKKLILNTLLPMADAGLSELGISNEDRERYLGIIRERVESGQTGAQWQVSFLQRTGRDMHLLADTYIQHQKTDEPVHRWELPPEPRKTQEPELRIIDDLPEGFSETPARQMYKLLGGPTLISLPGVDSPGIFVTVLLHGNEDSGLIAVQNVLRKYRDRRLPRPLHIFIGNVDAARYGLRRLIGQADYNRAWPGTELEPCSETRLMARLHEHLAGQELLLSVDLHNNSGINPHYACVNRLDRRFLHLALLFSRTVVYFTRPRGVQSLAMAELCPAVTVECGKVGDRLGIEQAEKFIGLCLNSDSLPEAEIGPEDIDLFHTVAQVKVPDRIRFNFQDEPADVHFHADLEYMNFREITPGTPFGDCANLTDPPLQVFNEAGDDVYSEYFEVNNGLLRITKPVMPSMLTLDERIIRQDCFCYLMERIALDGNPRAQISDSREGAKPRRKNKNSHGKTRKNTE